MKNILVNAYLEKNLGDDLFLKILFDRYPNVKWFIDTTDYTYKEVFKNYKNVDVIKNIALPTGILSDIDLVVYDRDVDYNDIIVMCSDGIIESNSEYKNKELWVKDLLEQMETTNAKKIADILLKEAIDNNYGKAKDDMTVIVTKIIKKS